MATSNVRNRKNYRPNSATWAFMLALLVVLGAFWPVWPYSISWGYYPATGIGLIAFVFFILFFTGALVAASDDEGGTPM